MSDPETLPRPQLVAVPEDATEADLAAPDDGAAPPDEAAGPERAAAEPAREKDESSWLPWLVAALALGVLALAIGWADSAQEANALGEDLARTQGELAATQQELAATRQSLAAAERRIAAWADHAQVARTRVSELAAALSGQLAELEAFLGTAPDGQAASDDASRTSEAPTGP